MMENIFDLIRKERKRQDELWGANRHRSDGDWLISLQEEIGEACEASFEGDTLHTITELVQANSVIVAWLEDLGSRVTRGEARSDVLARLGADPNIG